MFFLNIGKGVTWNGYVSWRNFSRNMQVIESGLKPRRLFQLCVDEELRAMWRAMIRYNLWLSGIEKTHVLSRVNNMIARLAELLLICNFLQVLRETRDSALHCRTLAFLLFYSTRLIYIFVTTINLHFSFWVSLRIAVSVLPRRL